MKIWLNDREIKESDSTIPCSYCVFNRDISCKPYVSNCLLRILNVRSDRDRCIRGYEYESKV